MTKYVPLTFVFTGFVAAMAVAAEAQAQVSVPEWSPNRPAVASPLPAQAPMLQANRLHATRLDQAAPGSTLTLVRNRNAAAGEPRFALANERGAIERLVEPVVGVDLTHHLGKRASIRFDTGKVLLSSQLDFSFDSRVAGGAVAQAGYQSSESRHEIYSRPRLTDGRFDPKRPVNRASTMAKQLVEEHAPVRDQGPLQSFFEWAGGDRLNRFISVGHPRQTTPGQAPAGDGEVALRP